ncbi:response regulator transcription factor [Clostridium sporogenes]|uniref:Stage 0 sporulation protein A homolog n=1 Tax=Clostridium botulinum TaxID=1491 RepID=A0A6M0SYL6_CLOBO|nr:response regulator transcription factor [Clostridium sporogenes]NFA58991.1 response regulator transcription factor [Clostridium botulinum]NFI72944.1 response regulator transcription factor [Clostridium sporogenes]NFM22985.1 response regulator transcription factor [Clostridium sporogenes]NFP60357.1 response regulator transcription factor [Clostridium sporogenes]NFU93434.1 response regulator transcription factor [Clostridium sporogenes]
MDKQRKGKILIVEDEVKISRFLQLELQYEGYEIEQAYDGREGLNKALNEKYDLILLDIMLPKLNGMEVCRRIRQISDIAIIMLTAKDETTDIVMGLDTGADDYISKPFAIEELLARIRVAFKRKKIDIKYSNTICIKGLELDLDKHIVYYNKEVIDLTKTEFDLLKFFMENKNIALNRDQILNKVWGFDYLGDTNVVDVYVRYLRTKIDNKYNERFIYTIRGVGYLLKDE